MPFSKIDADQFTLDKVKMMQAAFDAVCVEMNMVERDPRRSRVANIIIRLASEGDIGSLKEKALLAIKDEGR